MVCNPFRTPSIKQETSAGQDMTLRTAIVSLTGLTLSIAAVAGEQHRRVEITVDVDNGAPIAFDSESAGFDPLELQLGESRSVIDEDGNAVFVVRTEDGFDIESNGRRVSVPDPASLDGAYVDTMAGVSEEEAEVMRQIVIERMHEEHEIDVLHDVDLDEDVEVEREIRIVRKVVNDTN